MDSGMRNQDPHGPSIGSPTDQHPLIKNSFEEKGSDEEKAFEEESKTFSSQLRENSTQRQGSEPKTDKEENSKETEFKGRKSCVAPSEAERCSNRESSRRRKSRPRDSPRATADVGSEKEQDICGVPARLQGENWEWGPLGINRAGLSPMCYLRRASLGEERSVTLEKKTRKVPDAGHSSDCETTRDVCPRRAQRRRTGCSKRPRSRSPGVRPPPLQKCLVTSLRAMSEAIYQNTVRVQNQRVPSQLSWEQLSMLSQIRERLCAQVQTVYTMATQAAYVFPAETWLVPTPMPGPWGPAGDGEEA
ncbi:protein FRG2-like [Pteropus medius]|uniref:protein FRG2-like n=1 Tax=Pteropus vampyrus TaxID=132908 RepID=UPI00196B5688|nr:protein FRG2-like [Pteropus giganteus]